LSAEKPTPLQQKAGEMEPMKKLEFSSQGKNLFQKLEEFRSGSFESEREKRTGYVGGMGDISF
jgi:hypothetical protein